MQEFARRRKWGLWFIGVVVLGLMGLNLALKPSLSLALVLLGVGIGVILALWWLPKLQAAKAQGTNIKNRFDRENESRKTLAQIVGGVLLLAGLYSSVRTLDLQRRSGDLQRETENLQREEQITDRFTKAIDQLGAMTAGTDDKPRPNLEVRLGGIYALERIAKDSPKDHWTIMEVLTAYVRQNASAKKQAESAAAKRSERDLKRNPRFWLEKRPSVRADIQAILTVIGRRNPYDDPKNSYLDLAGTDLSGANFHGANLTGANLKGADLLRAVLNGANLSEADLSGADLSMAELGANLTGADLGGADLDRAYLYGAELAGASFVRSNFNEARLSSVALTGVDHLTQSQLNEAHGDAETILPPGLTRPASWGK